MFDLLPTAPHPAKYSDVLLPIMANMLKGSTRVLDPFGGTGKIFSLGLYLPELKISAIELEPEWARINPRTTVGNALSLPFADNTFDAIATSPTYANRMADTLIDEYDRITYTSKLGRKLHPDNSGQLQWGKSYRIFHWAAWREARRVLAPGGIFVLNIKDHIRNHEQVYVTEWHVYALETLGFVELERAEIDCPGMRYGQNADVRVGYESVIKLQLGDKRDE